MIISIRIDTEKAVPDLIDKALGRIYTIQGVSDVALVEHQPGVEELEHENRLLRARNERQTSERAEVIEEVAQALRRFQSAFGSDTIESFAVFVRGLK